MLFCFFYREEDRDRKEREHQQELEAQEKKSQKEISQLENKVRIVVIGVEYLTLIT